jgi:hypothetical protein
VEKQKQADAAQQYQLLLVRIRVKWIFRLTCNGTVMFYITSGLFLSSSSLQVIKSITCFYDILGGFEKYVMSEENSITKKKTCNNPYSIYISG